MSSTQIGKEKEAVEKVRQKLEVEFMNKKDLYFIVGHFSYQLSVISYQLSVISYQYRPLKPEA
ncbi:MAG: hypothetical protein SWX82_03225 [Cyanobacteriota bacterium]|nr:hypothetical protein [Cyanobacteriota bacterium]